MKDLPLRLRRINEKGLDVATRLAEMKAGKDVRLGMLSGLEGQPPGLTREEALTLFLARINRARERWNEGTLAQCAGCGTTLNDSLVDEIPWGLYCGACGGIGRQVEQ